MGCAPANAVRSRTAVLASSLAENAGYLRRDGKTGPNGVTGRRITWRGTRSSSADLTPIWEREMLLSRASISRSVRTVKILPDPLSASIHRLAGVRLRSLEVDDGPYDLHPYAATARVAGIQQSVRPFRGYNERLLAMLLQQQVRASPDVDRVHVPPEPELMKT